MLLKIPWCHDMLLSSMQRWPRDQKAKPPDNVTQIRRSSSPKENLLWFSSRMLLCTEAPLPLPSWHLFPQLGFLSLLPYYQVLRVESAKVKRKIDATPPWLSPHSSTQQGAPWGQTLDLIQIGLLATSTVSTTDMSVAWGSCQVSVHTHTWI